MHVREREGGGGEEGGRGRERVCVRERERESVCERERKRESVCVREGGRERRGEETVFHYFLLFKPLSLQFFPIVSFSSSHPGGKCHCYFLCLFFFYFHLLILYLFHYYFYFYFPYFSTFLFIFLILPPLFTTIFLPPVNIVEGI